ncbi:hypothetical protein WA026_012914 [Henosepilachna vigintioctopunctata]|uniref:LAGLIDADG homing endonuclease n=1 Tax=Henosepilachna vigintioctopunctata TaxID=420089 RepID=A0AAW1TT45_9CUCU
MPVWTTPNFLNVTFRQDELNIVSEKTLEDAVRWFLSNGMKLNSSNKGRLSTGGSNGSSVATYGILLWGHSPGLQKTLIRQKRTSCRPLFRTEGILTVVAMFILACIKYTIVNKMRFNRNDMIDTYDTRNKNNLALERHRLKKTQLGSNYWCLKFYNKLPVEWRDRSMSIV